LRRGRRGGAPGGIGGHTWAQRRGAGLDWSNCRPAVDAPAPSGCCALCGAPLAYLPRRAGAFLVPGETELRCSRECS